MNIEILYKLYKQGKPINNTTTYTDKVLIRFFDLLLYFETTFYYSKKIEFIDLVREWDNYRKIHEIKPITYLAVIPKEDDEILPYLAEEVKKERPELDIGDNLINWEDEVVNGDVTPLYDMVTYLKSIVNPGRNMYVPNLQPIIYEYEEKLDRRLQRLEANREYLIEEGIYDQQLQRIINEVTVERDRALMEAGDEAEFIRSLQPIFAEFFDQCFGLRKNENLLPPNIRLTLDYTYRNTITGIEETKTLIYDENDKYNFIYGMISVIVGCRVVNDRQYKYSDDDYEIPIVILKPLLNDRIIDFKFNVEEGNFNSGGFFPYYVKNCDNYKIMIGRTEYKLSKQTLEYFSELYQIFTQGGEYSQIKILPCLYYALRQQAKLLNVKLNDSINKLVQDGRYVSTCTLGDIGKSLDAEIVLYKPDDNYRGRPYNEGGSIKLKIGIYKNHFFSWEKIPGYGKLNVISVLQGLEEAGYFVVIPPSERKEIDLAMKFMLPILSNDVDVGARVDHLTGQYDITQPNKRINPLKYERYTSYVSGGNNKTSSGFTNDVLLSKKQRWFNKYDWVAVFDSETRVVNQEHVFLVGYVLCVRTIDLVRGNWNARKRERVIYNIEELGEYLSSLGGNVLVYVHNLAFDINFLYSICDNETIKIKSYIEKDNKIYSVVFKSGDNEFKFADSYKLIPIALSNFSKEFNLGDIKKEYNHYEYYNDPKVIGRNYMTKVESFIKKADDLEEATESIQRVGLDPKNFCPLEYMIRYCKQDCVVLLSGLCVFRKALNDSFQDIITNLNIRLPERCRALRIQPTLELFDYLTISSIAHEILIHLNCYEGVRQLRGGNRLFVQKTVNGGKCTCATERNRRIVDEPIVALDAVSLYPSAMTQCIGIPRGHGKVAEVGEMNDLMTKEKIYYVMRCKIEDIDEVKYSLPSFNYKKKWIHPTKQLIGKEIHIDSITYEDYVMLYNIKVKPLEMIYWTEFNPIGSVITKLFNMRKSYKDEGKKQLANVIKNLLNSCYGKTIMKIPDSKWVVDNGKTEECLIREKTRIKTKNGRANINMVKKLVPTYNEANFAHFGGMILSMSKHLMHRIMKLAPNDSIFYQDTDSLHIKESVIKKLADDYRELYGKELFGKNLCQLHVDYDFPGRDPNNLYSAYSIYISPKVYYEEIRDRTDPTFRADYFRCKGVPAKSILKYCKIHGITVCGLYMSMAKHKFNLLESVANIKVEGFGSVVTYTNGFTREIEFNIDRNCDKYEKDVEIIMNGGELRECRDWRELCQIVENFNER